MNHRVITVCFCYIISQSFYQIFIHSAKENVYFLEYFHLLLLCKYLQLAYCDQQPVQLFFFFGLVSSQMAQYDCSKRRHCEGGSSEYTVTFGCCLRPIWLRCLFGELILGRLSSPHHSTHTQPHTHTHTSCNCLLLPPYRLFLSSGVEEGSCHNI